MIDKVQLRKNALTKSLDWLIKSIDPTTGGSRANYSILFNGPKGWSGPYPETTGYIIPTFLKASKMVEGYASLRDKAIKMGEWLLAIQMEDGAYQGNIYYPGKETSKSIFNTGQIILGLTSLYDETRDNNYLEAAKRAAEWLASHQASDGTWKEYNYVANFSPSYYSRVSWPILKVFERTEDESFKVAAFKNLRHIQTQQLSNNFINGAGFRPDSYVFLHTLAYTIRGFIESGLILNDENLWNTGYSFAEKLMRHFEIHGKFYGAYYSDFSGVKWYQCLTGNVQMAIIWLKIYERTGDLRFLNAASKAIDTVEKHQVKRAWNKNLIGAVAGSAPFYGRYMFFRYPNWAVKFYCDALMLEAESINSIRV